MLRAHKHNKFLTISLSIFLVLSIASSCWVIIWYINSDINFVAEIEILNDDFETKYDFKGSGTALDPYIIENLEIKTKKPYGIMILNSTKHFIITNCKVNSEFMSIYISFAKYGTVIVENNFLSGRRGIEVNYSPGVVIKNNVIDATHTGISLTGCYNSTIKTNTCYNGYYGMFLVGYLNNSIIADNYCYNNSDSGITIYYVNFLTYDYVWGNNNVTFLNNNCNFNYLGMGIEYCDNSVIEKNNCSYNEIFVLFCGGINNTIKENYCSNNTIGISSYHLVNSTIRNNFLENNSEYGIRASDSSGNILYHNNFINNNMNGLLEGEKQAYDGYYGGSTNGKNLWYNPDLLEGNFWSELIWSPGVIYEIDGSDCVDEYPLENEIIIVYY